MRGNNGGRELRIPRNYIVVKVGETRCGGSSISKFLDSFGGREEKKEEGRRNSPVSRRTNVSFGVAGVSCENLHRKKLLLL